MKLFLTPFALFGCALLMSSGSHAHELPVLERPYLGQKPPGSTAEIFAPDIVNTAENREIEGMFAADMKAFFFRQETSW